MAIFKRPSIQLGSLKSFLNKHLQDTRVDTAHIYLNVAHAIGYDVYQVISKRTWLAESVYAALLYPERAESIGRFFKKQASRNRVLRSLDFKVWFGSKGCHTCDDSADRLARNWYGGFFRVPLSADIEPLYSPTDQKDIPRYHYAFRWLDGFKSFL